jgi:L-serine dehydratase
MESISVFDMLKIGVGPSSSHTLGPWRAVQRWLGELATETSLSHVDHVQVKLFGSLALTGRGHCTDTAICLALLGYDPVTVPVDDIPRLMEELIDEGHIEMGDRRIPFDPVSDILYLKSERLPGHANGMICRASVDGRPLESTYYSVGGGFVVGEGDEPGVASGVALPYPARSADDFLRHARKTGLRVAELVYANELTWRSGDAIRENLEDIWDVMRECVYRGCHTEGQLPGGLHVTRRAHDLHQSLLPDGRYGNSTEWLRLLRKNTARFSEVLRWVSCFALAVNEENAALGRVVTAPTNGAAGVIPAVLMYLICFSDRDVSSSDIANFLMVAGEIGSYFKKRATISAAMGGCQAEIGVSSAMAAAALAEALGGSVEQTFMAAEIAMEHHLGLTCDPVGGLVQIPCIERNSMGALKAINAAELALAGDPAAARVSLDEVIQTMDETARDMSLKYKETSEGGLAVNISVRVPEC